MSTITEDRSATAPSPPEAVSIPTLQELRHYVEGAWPADGRPPQIEETLVQEGKSLVARFIAAGDAHHSELVAADTLEDDHLELTGIDRARALVYTFEWPEGAKRFAVLWRNVLLEWERATVLAREGSATTEDLHILAQAAQGRLLEAAEHWLAEVDAELADLAGKPTRLEARLYEYNLQQNPWPTYRAQLGEVERQLDRLHANFATRLGSAATLVKLSDVLKAIPARIDEAFQELHDAAEVALGVVDDAENGQPGKVSTSRLESIDPLERYATLVEDMSREINALVDRLPEDCELYVADREGRLRYREINLERQTAQWLSAEALPGLTSGARGVEQAAADLSRTLVDVRNRVLLARERATSDVADADDSEEVANEDYVANLESLRVPISTYVERLGRIRREMGRDATSAARVVADELRLSRGYSPELSFLEVSFGAGISQVRRTQDALVTRIGDWFVRQRKSLRRLRNRVADEEALSTGERIVRVLRARRTDSANAAYTSVLITRGFIGEAFHAGREREIARAHEAVEAWRDGFRGSIVITGQRYSGKTHFAELIAGRYFEQATVRLRPGSTVELAGRTQPTTYDLAAALAFVRKHSVGSRLLVIIDDLELWVDKDHDLTGNARALRDAMDELSGRLAFAVTMGNWTLARLEDGLDLGAAFQLEVNLDSMPLEDFTQTVLTRHAATHLTMLDPEGQTLGEASLRDLAENVWRDARGNVGDGLRRWAQAVRRVDDSHVAIRSRQHYPLPNFIDADTGVVLAAVKHARYTNEYNLRRRFGPAFETHYRPIIRRLVRLEVLQRRRSGSLSINPVVTNEIARLLEREGHLKAHFSQAPLHL